MFRITIQEVTISTTGDLVEHENAHEVYRQTVDEINLKAIIAAVNAAKRGPRKEKVKA